MSTLGPELRGFRCCVGIEEAKRKENFKELKVKCGAQFHSISWYRKGVACGMKIKRIAGVFD